MKKHLSFTFVALGDGAEIVVDEDYKITAVRPPEKVEDKEGYAWGWLGKTYGKPK